MKQLANQLQSIIENGIRNNPLPYRKGNSIRIGSMIIRESKTQGYIIFDVSNSKQVSTAYSLAGALAITKKYMSSNTIKEVQYLDTRIEKFSNDCMFYKHTITNTKDELKKEIIEDRYDLAQAEIQKLKYNLENIIFNS